MACGMPHIKCRKLASPPSRRALYEATAHASLVVVQSPSCFIAVAVPSAKKHLMIDLYALLMAHDSRLSTLIREELWTVREGRAAIARHDQVWIYSMRPHRKSDFSPKFPESTSRALDVMEEVIAYETESRITDE